MPNASVLKEDFFDRTNAVIAAGVFLAAFITYALTVQPTFSFWDCGEFIACSVILGIPHPPGTPLFVLIGRLFSLVPFVEDISHRINYISVITSAMTAMFSYLLVVRLAGFFFGARKNESLNRYIAYVGGVAGGLFVALGRTNWANSVEAEVYGMALMLITMILWLTLRFIERRGTRSASRIIILIFYLATLGIGVHMTVFLIVPVVSLFFILKKDAGAREYAYLAGFIILELLFIILFSNGRGGSSAFYVVTAGLGAVLLVLLYRHVNWAILIAVASISSVMLSFSLYMWAVPVLIALMLVLAYMSEKRGWRLQWKTGLAIILVGVLGMSVHLFIPIRSAHNPRIDENNPSRDFRTFVKFLDRKQYGQQSMVERMFERRGAWSNQFGRHANMGFWSYFEEQWSQPGWAFLPLFLLGLLGLIVAIYKRMEVGLPILALVLICSVGLILYMNFADGTKFDVRTGDAYLEVRDRDYFFTPAFVFFGIAMGMGVSAVMMLVRNFLARSNPSMQKAGVVASSVLVLLPGFSWGHNYHANDRSENFIPYNYAANLLDTCEENAILFTSGDNDTFPLWCIQEAYNYRKDVRVVNLSLLNTDWYVYQMKHYYDVPISLADEQILWEPINIQWQGETHEMERPVEPFRDRPRGRTTYLVPGNYDGGIVKVQDMMVDEIVLENKWKDPIYFSSPPYAESPLKLADRATSVGVAYRLDREPPERLIDEEKGWDLYKNTYRFDGYRDSEVYRDDNATGVWLGYGINAVRLWDEYMRQNDTTGLLNISSFLINNYPEYWQMYFLLAHHYDQLGDSTKSDSLLWQLHDTLTAFLASNQENLFYMQDLGMTKIELASRNDDEQMREDGMDLMWKSFLAKPNSGHSFRKLFTVLSNQRRYSELQRALNIHAEYKRNLSDPFVQQLLGRSQPQAPSPPLNAPGN